MSAMAERCINLTVHQKEAELDRRASDSGLAVHRCLTRGDAMRKGTSGRHEEGSAGSHAVTCNQGAPEPT